MVITREIHVPTINATWVTGSTITFRPSQPIQLNNGMMVHHTQYCKNHTSIWFFRRGQSSTILLSDIVVFYSMSS